MADPTRYRGREPHRPRDDDQEYGQGRRHERDDGYIAQRGFGNDHSGYDRNEGRGSSGDQDRGRSYGGDFGGHDRGGRDQGGRDRGGQGRDYGSSSGYGTGGSTRDFREVTGRSYDDERFRRPDEFFQGGRERHHDRDPGTGFGRGSRDHRGDRGFFERAGDEVASWFGSDDAERRREQDAQRGDEGAQHHRGRGPRNYMRSDERIREDVNDRLTDDPQIDASDIEVAVQNREVTLTGTVQVRWAKRHAEDLAESVSGVTHVQNNLRVAQAASGSGSQSGSGSFGGAQGGSPQGGSSASGGGLNVGALGTGGLGSSGGTDMSGLDAPSRTDLGVGTSSQSGNKGSL